ncbi:MAG TPA: protein kinase [Candidatus Krumholzibacteria bacterium]|nr:protein kinase [Candidatus Krumholzibacteria bacterium]
MKPRLDVLPTEVIARHQVQKATPLHTSTLGSSTLPDSMLESARPRLAGAALLYASGYFGAMSLGTLAWVFLAGEPFVLNRGYAIAAFFIALSLVVYFLARSQKVPAHTLHAAGAVFGVVGSFGIGLGMYSDPKFADNPWGVSWVCVWMMAIPLIVPDTPRRAALGAFASAVAGGVAVFFCVAFFGDPVPSFGSLAATWYPNIVCAVLASLEARIIYGMGRDLERARQLGSYELVEPLGTGGMGEVWRARHQMLARPAAIKLVRPEFLGDQAQASLLLRRFEREAQATAALASPHSIELYDFGITRSGTFYYVMEYLDGLDLDTLVHRFGPLPPERVLYLLAQVCHSLADAHRLGLIHRDIKPANIFTCRMGLEHDFVKVLDFGLVRPVETKADDRLTADTVMTGTPAFMAPETVLGHDIDFRADLYALGCVGYWLLTGQLVFEGKTAMEVLVHHARTPPPPPSYRSELEIPSAIDDLILWCLEKEPDKRPQEATALAHRIAALVLPAPWNDDRARHWWEAHLPRGSSPADRAAADSAPSVARASLRS